MGLFVAVQMDPIELDNIDGGNRVEEEKARLEVERARERASLKHSTKSGRWSQAVGDIQGLDEERNAAVRDMVKRRDELRKKITGDVNDEFTVVGDLTIRGTTREVTLDASLQGRAKDPWGNDRAGFEAKGKINRSDFGLTWNQALEAGGVAVGDEVKISIDVELVKQEASVGAAA